MSSFLIVPGAGRVDSGGSSKISIVVVIPALIAVVDTKVQPWNYHCPERFRSTTTAAISLKRPSPGTIIGPNRYSTSFAETTTTPTTTPTEPWWPYLRLSLGGPIFRRRLSLRGPIFDAD